MTISIQLLLLLAALLLLVQLVVILKMRANYKEFLLEFKCLERALQISRTQVIDSERKRKWLINQNKILLRDGDHDEIS